jgi:hypothetical protein
MLIDFARREEAKNPELASELTTTQLDTRTTYDHAAEQKPTRRRAEEKVRGTGYDHKRRRSSDEVEAARKLTEEDWRAARAARETEDTYIACQNSNENCS